MARRQRYDHACELRAIADRVDALATATRLSTDEVVSAKIDLAKEIRAKADHLVSTDDPCPEGVFSAGRGVSASGKPFQAEIRRARAA